MYNENAKRATIKYMKEIRDKLTLNLPLGYKERYRDYAESQGKSLTALIMELMDKEIEKAEK